MNREEYRRSRRALAIDKRMYRAFSYFYPLPHVTTHYHLRKDVFESTIFIIYEEKRHRFDFEFTPAEPLPTIGQLRREIWADLLSLPVNYT